MTARAWMATSVAWLVAVAAAMPAAAQTSGVVTPGIAIGTFYDENVLWRPNAQSDHVWRVTPSIDFTRRSARSRLRVDGLIDGEWYSRFRVLSTIGARQYAGLLWDLRTSDVDTLGMAAGYESSINSSQINVGTALLVGRLRAWRWFFAPEHTHALNARTSLVSTFRLTREFTARPEGVLAEAPGVVINGGEFSVVRQLGERDELRPNYLAEFFAFRGADRMLSHRGMLRWTHRVTPSVKSVLAGGARFAQGGITPEVDVNISRRAGWRQALAGYTFTRTTTLGITRLVGVHHLLTTLSYFKPDGIGTGISAALYRSGLGDEQADVYRVAGDFSVPIAHPLAIVFSGAMDYQRGRIGIPLIPLSDVLPQAPDGSQLLVAPNAPIRRTTLMVAFVLSGSRTFASGPPEQPRPDNDPFSERRRR